MPECTPAHHPACHEPVNVYVQLPMPSHAPGLTGPAADRADLQPNTMTEVPVAHTARCTAKDPVKLRRGNRDVAVRPASGRLPP